MCLPGPPSERLPRTVLLPSTNPTAYYRSLRPHGSAAVVGPECEYPEGTMDRRWLLLTGLTLAASAPLRGQGLRVDRSAVAARAALRLPDQPLSAPLRLPGAWGIIGDTISRPHRSRVGTAALGLLAGAAAGVVVAYFVDRSRDSGEGRLENYIAIPLAIGAVTFMTVYVAAGD